MLYRVGTTDKEVDKGLSYPVSSTNLCELSAEPGHPRHQQGKSSPFPSQDIVHTSKSPRLRSRTVASNWECLGKTPLSTIVRHEDGHYFGLARCDEKKRLIQDFPQKRSLILLHNLLKESWNGERILVTCHSGLHGGRSTFDSSWLIPAIIIMPAPDYLLRACHRPVGGFRLTSYIYLRRTL